MTSSDVQTPAKPQGGDLFSGVPTQIPAGTSVTLRANRFEIQGFHFDIRMNGMPWRYNRNDGQHATFLRFIFEDPVTITITAVNLTRAWFYTPGTTYA